MREQFRDGFVAGTALFEHLTDSAKDTHRQLEEIAPQNFDISGLKLLRHGIPRPIKPLPCEHHPDWRLDPDGIRQQQRVWDGSRWRTVARR